MIRQAPQPGASGFTLIELLVVVAIIGVLAAIGIPAYQGYVDNARAATAHNGLRSIHLAQKEYHSENNVYYGTPAGNQTALLNTNLFAGVQTLEGAFYDYYVTLNTLNGAACTPPCYTAYARKRSDGTLLWITHLNTKNF